LKSNPEGGRVGNKKLKAQYTCNDSAHQQESGFRDNRKKKIKPWKYRENLRNNSYTINET